MYHLLIVDDESYTRQRIRTAINWEMLGIQILGEAENGLEALAAASEKKPDIVICDVRMPGMDGISFATELLRRFPAVQFIFVSGYSDKMYLKNALHLEAVDYIFKPYELSDLLAAVEKAISRIKRLDRDEAHPADEDLALKLVYCAQNPGELKQLLDKPMALDFNSPWIAFLIRFSSGLSFSNYQSRGISEFLQPQMLAGQYYHSFDLEISSLFQKRYLISRESSCYLVFANPAEEENGKLKDCLERLLSIIPSTPLAIGVSKTFRSPGEIRKAFLQARQASLSGFLSGYQKIYFASSLPCRRFSSEHEARENFLSALENRNTATAAGFLADYLSYIEGCSSGDIPAIKEELLHLTQQLSGRLKHPPFRFISEFINTAASLNDIRQYLQCLLDCYQSELNSLDSKERIIYEVEQYILTHLGENLSVRQIADNVYLSPTYLCYLYKKKTGQTLNQFILDSRMKKAKSLLLDTNIKIGDIAASLGYSNQNYFARLFASCYGATPSSFRSSNWNP